VNEAIARLFSLNGRVAIVTGGSRGIGAAIANGLAGAGARVIALARSAAPAVPLSSGIAYASCDVTAAGAFERLLADTFKREKRLDILVNAAGVSLAAEGAELERFDRTLVANLRAAYAACLAVAPLMEQSGGGSIINVTSVNSVLGFPANPGYVAAKGGLRMLTKALAIDLGPAKVRVNALAPGYIRTAMTAASHADAAARKAREQRTILGRFGETEDLVGAAIFLASDASSYITGTDLFVDGGWTAKGL
jgi:NAD(P)-dependent dehydrogenase (short-subunit alcohol dehydrogenase family)